jgi:hypothetical protein
MKKVLVIFVLLILPLISAVEIDMKTEFTQGETFMAKISGNFLEPIQKENLLFYREGHVRIPLEYDIAKIDDEFYVYALLGTKAPNNYSMSIENARYMSGPEISEENIVKEFTITEEVADFSVNPGFVIEDKGFVIEVQNLQDFKIEVGTSEEIETGDIIELKSGEIKELEFGIGEETSFRFVELKTNNLSYEIPVYVFVSQTETEEQEETEKQESKTEEETEKQEIKKVSTKTCEEINGVVCGSREKCDEASIQARDSTCCPGVCKEIKKNNAGKIIGWSMIVIIVAVLIWFFKTKYRGAKKDINLLDIAKGKDK